MDNIKSIGKREAAKSHSRPLQERACLRLGVEEAVPDEQVVLLVEEVLVEVTDLVLHFRVKRLRLRLVDGHCDEAVLMAVWVLVVECLGGYIEANLRQSVIFRIFKR